MMATIGFLGTGAITEAVVTGLCKGDQRSPEIRLSPRNAARAAALSERFDRVSVARDNQALVDASDTLCLALRPDTAGPLIEELRFRADQRIVSFISTLSLADLRPLVEPASPICCMVPLPPVADHLGPVVLCPPQKEIAELFAGIGTLVQVETEAQLHALWAVTAMMAPFFGFQSHISAWLEGKQVEPDQARAYVGSMIHALAVTGKNEADKGFAALIADHSTPQGLNEQALRELEQTAWGDSIAKVLDLIEDRLNGRAEFSDGLR